mmetsp:Transcript_102890/g.288384  ORF Transcript_102890/g.288384 Transcript_102890/m.288384 type:complete len:228 (+) Transcript_102890:31-714(+)
MRSNLPLPTAPVERGRAASAHWLKAKSCPNIEPDAHHPLLRRGRGALPATAATANKRFAMQRAHARAQPTPIGSSATHDEVQQRGRLAHLDHPRGAASDAVDGQNAVSHLDGLVWVLPVPEQHEPLDIVDADHGERALVGVVHVDAQRQAPLLDEHDLEQLPRFLPRDAGRGLRGVLQPFAGPRGLGPGPLGGAVVRVVLGLRELVGQHVFCKLAALRARAMATPGG